MFRIHTATAFLAFWEGKPLRLATPNTNPAQARRQTNMAADHTTPPPSPHSRCFFQHIALKMPGQ